jgi:hypothetical protein
LSATSIESRVPKRRDEIITRSPGHETSTAFWTRWVRGSEALRVDCYRARADFVAGLDRHRTIGELRGDRADDEVRVEQTRGVRRRIGL